MEHGSRRPTRGFDPAKKVEGRKRHLLVDTEGLVLGVRVHSARVPDADGIKLDLDPARERLGRLSHIWVDAGYQGRDKRWAEEAMGLSVEVVRKPPKPLPEEVAERWPLHRPERGRLRRYLREKHEDRPELPRLAATATGGRTSGCGPSWSGDDGGRYCKVTYLSRIFSGGEDLRGLKPYGERGAHLVFFCRGMDPALSVEFTSCRAMGSPALAETTMATPGHVQGYAGWEGKGQDAGLRLCLPAATKRLLHGCCT